MKILAYLVVLANVAFNSLAAANLPPPPPPEPSRLAEAERLVAALPLESVFGSSFNATHIVRMTTDHAVSMLSIRRTEEKDEAVNEVFRAKVRMVAENQLSEAINDARRNLAEEYARRLNLHDLASARAFAVTKEGRAFLTVQLDRDSQLPNLISRLLYDRLSGDLPRILRDAEQSSQLMERVNKSK